MGVFQGLGGRKGAGRGGYNLQLEIVPPPMSPVPGRGGGYPPLMMLDREVGVFQGLGGRKGAGRGGGITYS